MNRCSLVLMGLMLVGWGQAAVAGELRTWTDATGHYTIEARLIAFNDQQVVIERAEDQQLGVVPIEKLSEADQQYLKSKEAVEAAEELTGGEQKWTLRSGLQVIGRLVDYGRREVELKRRRGKTYVNGRVFENLPPIYQRIVLAIVQERGNRVTDAKSLASWLASRNGGPVTYEVEGVLLELESGDEYGVPFFLFSEEDLKVLKPGWEDWKLAHDDHQQRQEAAFLLQTAAARYQQDQRERQVIARMQLGLQAVEAGVTSVWEVTLYPSANTVGPPLWVPVFARDSRTAAQQALAQHPGYVVGPVRRVSR